MQSKNEPQAKALTPSSSDSKLPPHFSQSLPYHYLWNTLNFATIALTTSAGVVLVQSPIRTLLVNFSKSNALIPSYRGGMLGLVRALYAGTQASLSGSTIRTAYITKTKSNKPKEDGAEDLAYEEEGIKEKLFLASKPSKLTYIMEAALGIVVVTQIPTQLSDYRKAGLIPSPFKWYTYPNIYQLMSANFVPKYGASLINLSSLCVVEQKYADHLSSIDPSKVRFVSGALSGMTAAIWNYPLAAFVDYTQSRTRLEAGKLINKGVLESAKEMNKMFWADPKVSTGRFLKHAVKQLPLRMLSTGSVFSIVAGISNFLGTEPLRKIAPPEYIPPSVPIAYSFFKQSAPVARETLDEEVERIITRYMQ